MTGKIEKIAWKDEYSVGIQEVDDQHKQLVLMTHELYDLLVNRPGEYSKGIKKILQGLLDYTNYHFSCEENDYFRKQGYPSTEMHVLQHENFISEVQKQIMGVEDTTLEEGCALYNYLGNWLLTHIAQSDKDWANFILAKGTLK